MPDEGNRRGQCARCRESTGTVAPCSFSCLDPLYNISFNLNWALPLMPWSTGLPQIADVLDQHFQIQVDSDIRGRTKNLILQHLEPRTLQTAKAISMTLCWHLSHSVWQKMSRAYLIAPPRLQVIKRQDARLIHLCAAHLHVLDLTCTQEMCWVDALICFSGSKTSVTVIIIKTIIWTCSLELNQKLTEESFMWGN